MRTFSAGYENGIHEKWKPVYNQMGEVMKSNLSILLQVSQTAFLDYLLLISNRKHRLVDWTKGYT